MAGLPARPTRSRWSAPTPSTPPGYVVPERPQVVPQPGRRRSSCSRRCAGWTRTWPPADFDVDEQQRRLTEEARRREAARDADPHRLRDPLRRAAARGRLACPASSRPTTSAPTSASSAAPARASRCWSPRWSSASWPGGSASRTPELVGVELDAVIGSYEADEEVQDLLTASIGLNLGVDFLPGSFGYDAGYHAGPRGRGLRAVARRAHRERRPQLAQPEPAGLARPACGPSTTAPACTSTTAGPAASAPPERFARQPYDASDHVLRARTAPGCRPSTPSSPRRSPARCSPTCWAGARRVAGAGRRGGDAGRPARGVRRRSCSPGSAATGPGCRWRARHERADGLPVRRAALRAARGPGGVPQRRRGAALPGAPTSSRPAATSTATGCSPLAPEVDVDAVCSALAAVEAVCRGDASAGEAGRGSLGTRFGFVKAPRSTVVQPGPVHGGTTADPARQLDHLLDRLVR